MAKRVALSVVNKPLQAAASSHEGTAPDRGSRVTGINLPVVEWELLLDVATARKKQRGGRASVSAIILDLIRRHRTELEAELKA